MKIKKIPILLASLLTIVTITSCSFSMREFPSIPETSSASEGVNVTSVEVTKNPDKTSYYVGEVFDPTGMEIVATWSDGLTENIEDVISYPKTPFVLGDTSVELSYENYKFEVPVVVSKIPEITSLTIKEYPRTTYFNDEKFDSTGLVLHVEYDDGTSGDIIEGFTFDENITSETESVVITYRNKTVSIPLTILSGTSNKFEAEDFVLQGTATVFNAENAPDENINNPSGGQFVGELNKHMGSGYSFTFNSNKNTIAKFVLALGGNTESYNFNDSNRLIISYENSSRTIATKASINAGSWYNWQEYTMCVIDIKEGLNKISIINNGGCSSNVDYAIIHTDAVVSLSNEEIVLTGSKMECEDMTCVGESYVDREPNCGEPSGGYYIGGMNAAKKGAGVRFMVRSTVDCNARLTVQISKNGTVAYNFFDHHVITVYSDDGSKAVTYDKTNAPTISIPKGSNWFNWTEFDLLDIELNKGFTVIEITTAVVTDGSTRRSGNFDYVKLTNIDDNSKGFEFFNPTRFEAEDSATLKGTVATYNKAENYNNPSGSGFVSGMENINNSFSYDINVFEDVETNLMANIGLSDKEYYFSDIHKVVVTDESGVETELVYSNAKIAASDNPSIYGYDWRLFNIGTINLKKGLNKVTITHSSGEGSSNFDYLVFGTNVGITSQYENTKRYEAEDSKYENATLVSNTEHGASGDKYLSFGTSKTVLPSLTVEFSVTKETFVSFDLCVGLTTNTARQITLQYDIIFEDSKGAQYTFLPGYNFHKAQSNSGYSWRNYVMGFLVAQPGVNKFTIKRKENASYAYNHGFDYLDIKAYTPLA